MLTWTSFEFWIHFYLEIFIWNILPTLAFMMEFFMAIVCNFVIFMQNYIFIEKISQKIILTNKISKQSR